MAYLLKDYSAPGTAPGTLPSTPPESGPSRVFVLSYDHADVQNREITDLNDLEKLASQPIGRATWVHVIGLGDMNTIRRLGEMFNLHPLALEDVVHRGQRPKVEDYPQHAFAVFQYPAMPADRVTMQQVALFLSKNLVITFQANGPDILSPVRERVIHGSGHIRERGADYLAYAIMDLLVDSAFPLLEKLGERLAALEDRIVSRPGAGENIRNIHQMRRDLLRLQRVFWPQRDLFARLLRECEDWFEPATRTYLRDLHDHAVQVLDIVESYREMAASLLDLHFSGLSVRLNDIMRVLAVISTLFMPLTFVVGLYGMNFDRSSPWNMPELGWEYGYPVLWGLMLAMVAGMILFFRRKGWF
jgi:magnesium transporter